MQRPARTRISGALDDLRTLDPVLQNNYGLEFTADRYLHEPDTTRGQQIGELSVHHENMKRLLAEQPHSLNPVLNALLSALQEEHEFTCPVENLAESPHPVLSQSANDHPLRIST